MNNKKIITMVYKQTGEIREFTGYWSLSEIYRMLKNYKKDGRWIVIRIDSEDILL